ncbi:hypothetical protein [Streptomyces sp. NPDC007172]|uniref:hypothetical protein n=1 Tax=Streptomyces sp. NPDC007172 TaxID=3364776 RepID=UPI0036C27A55
MLEWSLKTGRYLQTTGYRGYLNCDSILSADGELPTLLTRNDLHVDSFEKLAWAIGHDEHLNGNSGTGALLLVDDVPHTGTVQYLAYGPSPSAAAYAEDRLHETATAC